MPGDSHVDQPSPYGVCLASSLLMIDSVPFLPRNHMSIEYGVDGCRIGLPRPFSSRLTGIHPASLGGGGGGGGGIITLKSLVANDLPPSPPPSLPKLCVTPLLRVQMPYVSSRWLQMSQPFPLPPRTHVTTVTAPGAGTKLVVFSPR